MVLCNAKKCIIIAGIIIAVTLGALVFVTAPKEGDKFPDRYAHFDYSFSFPDIAEEIDKSKEAKAWIGYDENMLKRPFARHVEVNRNWLPSSNEVRMFLGDNYSMVERIVEERSQSWISVETARSIVEQYWKNDGPLSGHCGQYNYIQTYVLFIPTSNDEIAFVLVVLPNPAAICFPDRLLEEAYGPLLETPSIEQPRTFDFAKILEISYGFIYSNLLLLAVTPVLLLGALVWRGGISRIWITNGFRYEHFELMVKMRGSRTRLEILQAVDVPKTRQYIAQELNLDWKAVDRHVKALLKHDLISEICSVGQATYYVRSESGDKLLTLVENEYFGLNDNRCGKMLSITQFRI